MVLWYTKLYYKKKWPLLRAAGNGRAYNMDVQNTIGGSLQISTEVLAKIARLAALEVDGVAQVTAGSNQNVRGLLGRTGLRKAVSVTLDDGVASVAVHLTVRYGHKIMPLCENVQENVKQTIQNMTGITVSRVDVLVVGLAQPETQD